MNSDHEDAINLNSRASMQGLNIYSSGGYAGKDTNFSPLPIVDSPTIADPLAERSPPSVGSCDHTDFFISDVVETVYPGTYCGGFVAANSEVTFRPGVYVIKDGPLEARGATTFTGDFVGFYLTGEDATFRIDPPTITSLKAPKTGDMSGIIFFEDRDSSEDRIFDIRSKQAEKMEGVIYLSRGKLFIDKQSRIGQASKWSAIIANSIEIGDGPEIQINSDFAGSDIPAPAGISGVDERVYLTQ